MSTNIVSGSKNAGIGGKLSLTLFDPMTHTIEKYVAQIGLLFFYSRCISRSSGIGDHGPVGIQDFITNHVCNYICSGLHLVSTTVLQNTLDDLLGNDHMRGYEPEAASPGEGDIDQ